MVAPIKSKSSTVPKRGKPVPIQLCRQIDALGQLRGQLHALAAKERALTILVREGMAAGQLTSAEGKVFHADLVEQARLAIDNVSGFRRAAGEKAFMQCVKVQVAPAKRLLGEAKLDELVSAGVASREVVLLLEVRARE